MRIWRTSAVLVGATSLGLALVTPQTATIASVTSSAATPSAGRSQWAVARSSHHIGETRPGVGVAQVTVRKHRVVEVEIQYRYWRCTGPGERRRQEMGWDLTTFSPGNPRLRIGRDGRFAYRLKQGGRKTFSRFAVTGRFSAHGRRVAGTFRWHQRGITGRGRVECRSPLIHYTAWVSEREFAGRTSQGVPWRGSLTWIFDVYEWMFGGSPPYITGSLNPDIDETPPTGPFAEVLLKCPPGLYEYVAIVAAVDPRTGRLTGPSPEPGEQLVLTGRASPLAEPGLASVSLSISYHKQWSATEFCDGSATFRTTELAPLVH